MCGGGGRTKQVAQGDLGIWLWLEHRICSIPIVSHSGCAAETLHRGREVGLFD